MTTLRATTVDATTDDTWVQDPARIRPGDRIEVWEQDHLRHVGTVGQCAPHLRLLWILEAGTGSRRLIPVHGYRLRRSPFARPVAWGLVAAIAGALVGTALSRPPSGARAVAGQAITFGRLSPFARPA